MPESGAQSLSAIVEEAVANAPVFDVHTHLYAPQFGELNLWGVDELVTYHYLIAELFRFCPITPEQYWSMSKPEQADLIWDTLFVKNTPLSEAAIGVTTALTAFGLDPSARDLGEARALCRSQDPAEYVDLVLQAANVSDLSMTNDPLDDRERRIWESGMSFDSRFHAVLRLDPILNALPDSAPRLQSMGYEVMPDLSGKSVDSLRRYVDDWSDRLNPLYMAVSLPYTFAYPEESVRIRILREAVLPACRERGIPFAMMIGVKRTANPRLREAGDSVGPADVGAVERICVDYPDNRFLVTMLARENQHGLCVAARKFANLMPFGCWWFLNNPSIIAEITRERLELLGTSFIPQHSDARILDQLLYKWPHSRRVIAKALTDSYESLVRAGRVATQQDIERDVARLFSGNFQRFAGGSAG